MIWNSSPEPSGTLRNPPNLREVSHLLQFGTSSTRAGDQADVSSNQLPRIRKYTSSQTFKVEYSPKYTTSTSALVDEPPQSVSPYTQRVLSTSMPCNSVGSLGCGSGCCGGAVFRVVLSGSSGGGGGGKDSVIVHPACFQIFKKNRIPVFKFQTPNYTPNTPKAKIPKNQQKISNTYQPMARITTS